MDQSFYQRGGERIPEESERLKKFAGSYPLYVSLELIKKIILMV